MKKRVGKVDIEARPKDPTGCRLANTVVDREEGNCRKKTSPSKNRSSITRGMPFYKKGQSLGDLRTSSVRQPSAGLAYMGGLHGREAREVSKSAIWGRSEGCFTSQLRGHATPAHYKLKVENNSFISHEEKGLTKGGPEDHDAVSTHQR